MCDRDSISKSIYSINHVKMGRQIDKNDWKLINTSVVPNTQTTWRKYSQNTKEKNSYCIRSTVYLGYLKISVGIEIQMDSSQNKRNCHLKRKTH